MRHPTFRRPHKQSNLSNREHRQSTKNDDDNNNNNNNNNNNGNHGATPHMSRSAPSWPKPLLLEPNTRSVLPAGII